MSGEIRVSRLRVLLKIVSLIDTVVELYPNQGAVTLEQEALLQIVDRSLKCKPWDDNRRFLSNRIVVFCPCLYRACGAQTRISPRSLGLDALREDSRKIPSCPPSQNSPQNKNQNGQRKPVGCHQSVKQKDIDDNWAKENQGQRHITVE